MEKNQGLCSDIPDTNADMLTQANNVCFLKSFIEYFVYLGMDAQIYSNDHIWL